MESLPFNRNFQLDPTKELTNIDDKRNNLIKMRLNFPVLWANKFKVYGSLDYRRETTHVVTAADVPQPVTLRWYQTGLNFRYELALQNQEFLMGHVGANFRSDRIQFNDLSYSVSVGWGRKLTDHKKFALGMGVENAWGRWRFSPLFLYQNRINQKWDLSLLLPKQAKLTHYLNQGFHVLAEAKGSSALYKIDDHELLPGYPELEYRSRRVSFNLGLEKQIYDWFWIGAYAGIVTPLNTLLVEPRKPSRAHLYNFEPEADRFIKFSVFIVPPQKLFNKLNGN